MAILTRGRSAESHQTKPRSYEPDPVSRAARASERVGETLEGLSGIVATGKLLTLREFARLFEAHPNIVLNSLRLMDPEKSADEMRQLGLSPYVEMTEAAGSLEVPDKAIDYERPKKTIVYDGTPEPESNHALSPALSKLKAIYENYLLQLREHENLDPNERVIFSADVVFGIARNGEKLPQHRFLRTIEEIINYQNLPINHPERLATDNRIRRELEELYSHKDFTAVWDVAFGATLDGLHRVAAISIKADFPALTQEEIRENYEPYANTGIRLMELGQKKEIPFYIEGPDGKILIDPEIAMQLIVAKVPPIELLDYMLNLVVSENPRGVGMLLGTANRLVNRIFDRRPKMSQGETQEYEVGQNPDYLNALYSALLYLCAAEPASEHQNI